MTSKLKVLAVFGTRPEAIKMAPLITALQKQPERFDAKVCVTAQHRQMLDQVLELFNIKPNYDLNVMKPNQDLWNLTADVLVQMKEVFEEARPDLVLVHGDTTTTLAASLSAFYAKVTVAHVEAGLRTFNKYYPFPEEINRVVADAISGLHFAPTQRSVDNLLASGISPQSIYLTGNTVIDALLYTVEKAQVALPSWGLDPNLKTILLTSHRRENFGEPLQEICRAILTLIKNNSGIQVVYPVHLNPNVRETVYSLLGGVSRVHLIEPLDYAPFCQLLKQAYIVLTDSGGVQEEAPSLGKPVLVLRDETERPEAVQFGTVKLVGSNHDKIVSTTQELLDSPQRYHQMASVTNPYGDGLASQRIIEAIEENRKKLLQKSL
jgi:UDP-N-acetylglucosamine 2-epimerase (non-hydrolysing)